MVTNEYKREKLMLWRPDWSPLTIAKFTPAQLEAVYRREQQAAIDRLVNGVRQQAEQLTLY